MRRSGIAIGREIGTPGGETGHDSETNSGEGTLAGQNPLAGAWFLLAR
jgi:hypothetical protein